MQQNLLLLGGTGHLGRQIAQALQGKIYNTIALVRSEGKGESLKPFVAECKVADVLEPRELPRICENISVVVSALGKAVSPNSKDKPSFYDVDYKGNLNVLNEAMKSGVKKFVYVSALGAERHQDLAYFKAHHLFSQKLIASGINYSIIQPPALFSAFLDLVAMAPKGRLMQIGRGDKKTNPIDEGELARLCVDAIEKPNAILHPGGRTVYTRREITEIIQRIVAPQKKFRNVPVGLVKLFLPLLKFFDQNTYNKIAFFLRVMEEDTLADRIGMKTLEEYITDYVSRQNNLVTQSL